MGLRCSLLGHDYGESTTEREREEQGGEVVVEVRDLRICARCGAEKVLSENTEVRTLEAGVERGDTDAAVSDQPPEADTEQSSLEATEGYIEEVDETTDVAGAAGADETAGSTGTPAEHAPSAEEDDAVIIEDEPDQERDRGQWPDEAQQEALTDTVDETDAEPSPWPEHEGEDEGFDAKPSAGDDAGVEFGGSLTPEAAEPGEADDEGYVEAPPSEPDPSGGGSTDGTTSADSFKQRGSPPPSQPSRGEAAATSTGEAGGERSGEPAVGDTGFTSAGPVNPPTGSTDDVDTVLVCPECGFERTAARASLRAGDICPECRRGYLAERR